MRLRYSYFRNAGLAAIVAGAVLLAGCAHDDPKYLPSPLTEYKPGLAVNIAWRTSIGSGSGYGFIPVVLGNAVYAATPDGDVGKFDLLSGHTIWKVSLKDKLAAGVGTNGQTIVVTSPSGKVIALNDQGKQLWEQQASSTVSIPALVGNGVVVVRSGDYRVQAYDEKTGTPLWNVQRPGPALALRGSEQMAMTQGLVITGLPSGRLMAIDTATGSVQWEGVVAAASGASDLERLTDVMGSPLLHANLLCAGAYQGRIACFDAAQGGRQVWAKNYSTPVGISADSQAIYSSSSVSDVDAFSFTDGSALWKQDALRNRSLTVPAPIGQAVAVGDYQGYVHFLSSQDGHLLARLSVGGDAVLSPPVSTSQGVLVQTGNGDLVMIAEH